MDWHKGPPPRTPGVWYVAHEVHGHVTIVTATQGNSELWHTAKARDYYRAEDLTHHLPTPIQPPKES